MPLGGLAHPGLVRAASPADELADRRPPLPLPLLIVFARLVAQLLEWLLPRALASQHRRFYAACRQDSMLRFSSWLLLCFRSTRSQVILRCDGHPVGLRKWVCVHVLRFSFGLRSRHESARSCVAGAAWRLCDRDRPPPALPPGLADRARDVRMVAPASACRRAAMRGGVLHVERRPRLRSYPPRPHARLPCPPPFGSSDSSVGVARAGWAGTKRGGRCRSVRAVARLASDASEIWVGPQWLGETEVGTGIVVDRPAVGRLGPSF